MKRIIFTIVFVLWTSTLFAQYKMSIKKADNTTQDIWIHDITEITFTNVVFTCGTSTITYAGQTYNTVLKGSQCWLKENLNIGTRIDGSGDQTDNSTIEKYCYDDDSDNCDTYGGLYQWNEAMQYITTAGAQGICPTGWHIPTKTEFETLQSAVGNDVNKLLAVGQGGGTNTSGFSALLGGFREFSEGTYVNLSSIAYFWSSTVYISGFSYYMSLDTNPSEITITNTNINHGFSVRCLKN